jgi:hypothetical protein
MNIRRSMILLPVCGAAAAILAVPGPALALQTPTTGQPGAPAVTCFSSPDTANSPGHAAGAQGSPFNANGVSGGVYAGNPGTASLAHANSTAAVSQYDVACLQVTSH